MRFAGTFASAFWNLDLAVTVARMIRHHRKYGQS
jgi:hypothetical protein